MASVLGILRETRSAPTFPSQLNGDAGAGNDAQHTLEKDHEQMWNDLHQFYDENEGMIEKAQALEPAAIARDEKATELEVAIDTFLETADVVLKGLVALGNVHPVLGIAIFAFHGIITLDLTRRDNNRKVLAVKLQMQSMMCAMFQLRKLKHVHVEPKEHETERKRLQKLVSAIAEDITQCGSDLNYYMGRKFVSKLINAKTYEGRFADHIATFSDRRAELQSTITSYIAAGMDTANLGIEQLGKGLGEVNSDLKGVNIGLKGINASLVDVKDSLRTIGKLKSAVDGIDEKVAGVSGIDTRISSIDEKIESLTSSIASLLRTLDTPRERACKRYIEQNGGVEQCVGRDELLEGLLGKAGVSSDMDGSSSSGLDPLSGATTTTSTSASPRVSSSPSTTNLSTSTPTPSLSTSGAAALKIKKETLASVRSSLRSELAQDLREVLKDNVQLFEKRLKIQYWNLERGMADLGGGVNRVKRGIDVVRDGQKMMLGGQQSIMDGQAKEIEALDKHSKRLDDHSNKLDTLVRNSLLILEEGRFTRRAVMNAGTNGVGEGERLVDPVLQRIWDTMGLRDKGNVKAKHFVLTLRDYLCAIAGDVRAEDNQPTHPDIPSGTLSAASSSAGTPRATHESLSAIDGLPTLDFKAKLPGISNSELQDLDWALAFLSPSNPSGVHPLVEAIDQDGSGYVSVQEANGYALGRPVGWSFVRWLAYTSHGFHILITSYRSKIYTTIQAMHSSLLKAHPANRVYVDGYLAGSWGNRLEAMLRSTKVAQDLDGGYQVLQDSATYMAGTRNRKGRSIGAYAKASEGSKRELLDSAKFMALMQETRLLANLKEIGWRLDSPEDVLLVVGGESSGRKCETWIYPLLHLILSHHLSILRLGERRVLHPSELIIHSKTLEEVFVVFDERLRYLEAVFRHMHRDVSTQFANFSYGMFHASYLHAERSPLDNTLLTFEDTNIRDQSLSLGLAPLNAVSDPTNLTLGLGKNFNFKEVPIASTSQSNPSQSDIDRHPIDGFWTGECLRANNSEIAYQGFFHGAIHVGKDNEISGQGETYIGGVEFAGFVHGSTQGSPTAGSKIPVLLSIYSDLYADLICRGFYDPEREAIQGFWAWDADSKQFPATGDTLADEEARKTLDLKYPCGRFYMTRTPPEIFRFRYLLASPHSSPSPLLSSSTEARKRWAFAISAIRFQTEHRIGSANFFRERTAERRKWIELTIRRELDKAMAFKLKQEEKSGSWLSLTMTTREQLSMDGKKELWRLRRQMHPTNGRLYVMLSQYLLERMIYDVGRYNCVSCDRRIIFARFQCISCMDDRLASRLDLCVDCIDSPDLPDDFSDASADVEFTHHTSHSLIRSTHRIHDCEIASVVPQARLKSERVKTVFSAYEARLEASKTNSFIEVPKFPFRCACCSQNVTLPCWICVSCALDTFICISCDTKRRPVLNRQGFSSSHTSEHPLLRIHDATAVSPNRVRSTRVERRLKKQEERILALEGSVHRLEATVESQLGTIVALMRQLVPTTGRGPGPGLPTFGIGTVGSGTATPRPATPSTPPSTRFKMLDRTPPDTPSVLSKVEAHERKRYE